MRRTQVCDPKNMNDWIIVGFSLIIIFYHVGILWFFVKVRLKKECHDRLPTEWIWLGVMYLFSHFELDNKYYEDVRISGHNAYELHNPLHLRRNTLLFWQYKPQRIWSHVTHNIWFRVVKEILKLNNFNIDFVEYNT